MISKRAKRIGLAVLAVAVAVQLVRFGVHRADDWLRADPSRLPPALQIRRQSVQLASEPVAQPDVGFVGQPRERRLVETDDYTYTAIGDSRGFPNADPDWNRADIVFLGDSLVVGHGVGVEGGFVELAGGMLNAAVVNLGSGGAGPERQYRIYRRYGTATGAGLVVACIYLASDFENDEHFRAWLDDPLGMEYNRFRLSYWQRAEKRSTFSLSKRLERHPLYYWLQAVIEPHLWGAYKTLHELEMPDGESLLFDRAAIGFAKTPYDGSETEVRYLVDSVDGLRLLANESGASVAVLLIPSKEEVFGVPEAATARGAAKAVEGQLTGIGIPVLDLIPVLRARGSEHTPYYRRDIHLNAFGNAVVAEAVAEWVRGVPARVQ